MSPNELRDLLIDCRIELRKSMREFAKSELCERIDAAMQTLSSAPGKSDTTAVAAATLPVSARVIKETSNQVALAWQTAARDLKFSNPPLYEAMSKKVMSRLESKTLVDQVDELRELEDEIAGERKSAGETEKLRLALEAERDTLLGALANACPQLSDGGDRVGVALARIEWLKAHGARSQPGSAAAAAAAEEESRVPTPEILVLIAAGSRRFTNAQREWSVGEAMVLSGFRFTPMELIEQGDAQIAKIIREAVQG